MGELGLLFMFYISECFRMKRGECGLKPSVPSLSISKWDFRTWCVLPRLLSRLIGSTNYLAKVFLEEIISHVPLLHAVSRIPPEAQMPDINHLVLSPRTHLSHWIP